MHAVETNGAKMAVLLLIHGHRHLGVDVDRDGLRNNLRGGSIRYTRLESQCMSRRMKSGVVNAFKDAEASECRFEVCFV